MDRRTARHHAKRATIVAEAWALARRDGLGAISLRDLAEQVDLRQPSLYAYFDSKLALYDAMFADGNRELLGRLDSLELPADPRVALKVLLGAFADFALEDPARNSLLFRRVIPGFEPSPESYALAVDALSHVLAVMNDAGVTDSGDVDCMIAMVAGLIEAQLSNEPGGDRWLRHLDRMVDLLADDAHVRNP